MKTRHCFLSRACWAVVALVLAQCLDARVACGDEAVAPTESGRLASVFADPEPGDEGAPRADSLGVYVILTNLMKKDSYYQVVAELRKHRNASATIFFKGQSVQTVLSRLKELAPEYVAIVTRPETIDVNFAYTVLETAIRLDSDPFPDFAYGFVTGASAEEALEFVRNIVRAEEKTGAISARIFEFGHPDRAELNKSAFTWAAGFTGSTFAHEEDSFPEKRLADLAGNAAVRFWGHGSPRRVDKSLTAEQLKGVNLYPAVVFGGPCYAGVTSRSFEVKDGGKVGMLTIPPRESLCLRLVASGATGYFAALHEDLCISSGQELERALSAGEPLGRVMKGTYDSLVLSAQTDRLELPRFVEAGTPPQVSNVFGRCSDAASRVLFGDPAFAPFKGVESRPVVADVRRTDETLAVTLRVGDSSFTYSFTDVYHRWLGGKQCRNDRLAATIELPRDFESAGRVCLVEARRGREVLSPADVYCALEKWGGERRLHVQVDFRGGTLKSGDVTAEIEVVPDAGSLERKALDALPSAFVLLLFRKTCGECRNTQHVLDKLAEYCGEGIEIMPVDIDDSPDVARDYGVNRFPAVILFDRHGNEKFLTTDLSDAGEFVRLLGHLAAETGPGRRK